MSAGDYSEAEAEQAPLELEARTSEPARTTEPPSVEGLTVPEAATAFGLSVSTVRRLLKSDKLPGVAKVPGPKGVEYRIPPAALEALGYKPRETQGGAMLTAARAQLEAEQLSATVARLEAALEVEQVRREAAERQAATLEANLEDLRLALSKLPAALEPPKRRRILRR